MEVWVVHTEYNLPDYKRSESGSSIVGVYKDASAAFKEAIRLNREYIIVGQGEYIVSEFEACTCHLRPEERKEIVRVYHENKDKDIESMDLEQLDEYCDALESILYLRDYESPSLHPYYRKAAVSNFEVV